MNVGIIGLGNMGRGMAASLVRGGHHVVAYNRTPGRAEGLSGALQAKTVAEAATMDVVLTMVSDDAAVEALTQDIISAMQANAVHVSMSTISVACCERLEARHSAAQRGFIAAPVWGRPAVAEAGKLMIVPAGDAQLIERCRPAFESMGERIFVLGSKPSMANLAKLSGNFMIAGLIEGLSEAFALARKGGIEPATYLELLRTTLFQLPVQATYAGIIAEQQFEPAGFRAVLGLKDVRLVQEAAATLQVPMPLASLLHDHLMSAVAQGLGDKDWTIVSRLLAERAGLED